MAAGFKVVVNKWLTEVCISGATILDIIIYVSYIRFNPRGPVRIDLDDKTASREWWLIFSDE
jgi:hypothetical protein